MTEGEDKTGNVLNLYATRVTARHKLCDFFVFNVRHVRREYRQQKPFNHLIMLLWFGRAFG